MIIFIIKMDKMNLHVLLNLFLDKVILLKKKTQQYPRENNLAFFSVVLDSGLLESQFAHLFRIASTFMGKDEGLHLFRLDNRILQTDFYILEDHPLFKDKEFMELISTPKYLTKTHNLNVIVKCIGIMLGHLLNVLDAEISKESSLLFAGSLNDLRRCVLLCLKEIPTFIEKYEICFKENIDVNKPPRVKKTPILKN